MRKTRVTIPFATCPATLPIVSLYLANGEVWHAAIDSGSECTVFNAEFVRKNAGDFTADNQEVKAIIDLGRMSIRIMVPVDIPAKTA